MTGYPFPLLLAFWLFAGAGVSPETVVATINGRKITAGEVDRILLGAPGALQQNLRENRKLFIDIYALVSTLAAMAEASVPARASISASSQPAPGMLPPRTPRSR